jgi:hypothetical protein
MTPRRFSSAFLMALAATAGAAQAAAVHGTRATSPAVTRSAMQARSIDDAVRQGRLTARQAEVLRAARASQEQRARDLGRHPGDVGAALDLSHQQDRLDWAIRSGNTAFIDATPLR